MLYIVISISIFVVVLSMIVSFWKRNFDGSLKGEHVMVTGGSSGIGLAFAIEAAERGASVSIIARNKEKLEEAKKEVQSHAVSADQKISAFSIDVSCNSEMLEETVKQAENALGPIFMLVNCAGTSVCYRFEETPVTELEKMLNVNFYGSVYITRHVVPLMKQRKRGKILFFSSIAGIFGLYGYSAYSSSKFAVVGMAEALCMEVKPYNIGVTVSFPPDTETPGFAEEIKTKLPETNLISEAGGLYSAKQVAQKALEDSLKNRFMSTLGFQSWMVCTACCGMSPASWPDLILQVLTMGFFRLFGYIYLQFCDKTIKNCVLGRS